MHYRLYLPQYQPYQVYQPCCYAWGVAIHNGQRRVRGGNR